MFSYIRHSFLHLHNIISSFYQFVKFCVYISILTPHCGGTYGYEEYYPNDEGREELDIDFINDELEDYKGFAEQLYDREMF